MPSLTRNIPHNSDQERMILKEMQLRVRLWERLTQSKFVKWKDAEEKILAYVPERDVDAIRRNTREGGLPQYTTIQIPYSYAVVMAAHTYLTSVFMGRDPVFQFTGRHGETQQKIQALEALVSYQVLVGRMLPYLYTFLYDSLKYGVGIVGLYWDERIETITTISEQQLPGSDGLLGPVEKIQKSERSRVYAGNRVYNIQPQDFIWDVRYTMREFQSGEFTGERRKLGWNEVVRRKKQGYYCNIEHIGYGRGRNVFVNEQGSSILERPESLSAFSDGEIGYGDEKKHPMMIGVFQLVIEIIPDEWKLGGSDYPEKWVFTCTDDFGVVIGAQPLGARHCKFPYVVNPLEPEGYGLTTRGLPEVLEPVQNTVDWLINSHFYNVRAALNDRIIVDPSMVVMKDILDPLPGKVVRMRPEGFGKDPKTVVTQMPTSNVTQAHMNDIPFMFGIGERIGGVNDQIMGMLSTGGRKTATEVRTSTSFGINRLKTTAEFASACAFDPLSMLIVANSQQYYDMETQFKIAGDLLMNAGPSMQMQPGMPPQATPGFITVNPEMISGFYDFVPVDGTLPIDKMAQVQLWESLMGQAVQIPGIAMGYDWQGIFTWIAQLAGLKNITQFKVQIMPDQLLAAQMQQGNSIPLNGGGMPSSQTKPTVTMPQGIMGAA